MGSRPRAHRGLLRLFEEVIVSFNFHRGLSSVDGRDVRIQTVMMKKNRICLIWTLKSRGRKERLIYYEFDRNGNRSQSQTEER